MMWTGPAQSRLPKTPIRFVVLQSALVGHLLACGPPLSSDDKGSISTDTGGSIEPSHPVEIDLLEPAERITGPFVLTEGGTTRAWVKTKSGSASQILTLQVIDGLHWEQDSSCTPIREGDAGEDHAKGLGTPSVRASEAGWEMFYRVDGPKGRQAIARSTSTDGCQWQTPAVVFEPGEEDWASQALVGPHVIDGPTGDLWLFYRGSPHGNQSVSSIGLATSSDGQAWIPWPDNPVLDRAEVPWGTSLLADPHIWQDGEDWWMLLSGHARTTTPEDSKDAVGIDKQIGLAWSPDGTSWDAAVEHLFVHGVKSDNPFLWEDSDGRWLYYRMTDEADGSGGGIWRTSWEGL